MDDFDLFLPKKILRFVLVASLLVAIVWGLITGDMKNGADLWIKEVTIITKPLVDRLLNPMERAVSNAQKSSETTSTTSSMLTQ